MGSSCPTYRTTTYSHSTDFEVHRNWLAITHSLPLDKWYVDTTSEWTLDYPPLFAWFEWCLAKIAFYFDPEMLRLSNLNYASEMTVTFQRLSVIITDLVYAYAVKECVHEVERCQGKHSNIISPLFAILFANAGLFIVDHIHFQYNGFLYGIMFLSMARILQGREIEGGFWFAVLLNLKHIYLYIAPAYFVYLLRSFCFSSKPDGSVNWRSLSLARLVMLGAVVITVFAVSFGPFILKGQLAQVLQRLFPFKRGLSHAYWAPNFWALYNFADKVLSLAGSKLGLLPPVQTGVMTGGLVQEFDHVVLPSIPPIATFIATLASIVPILVHLWQRPHNPWQFVRAVVLCGFGSFMFGWHVHEKAVLLIVLPLGLLCTQHIKEARFFILLSIVGHFSLFPLLFTNHETPIKVLLLLVHAFYTMSELSFHWSKGKQNFSIDLCSRHEALYLWGLPFLFLYQEVLHPGLGLQERLPFLPLMFISVYCALGVTYVWITYYCFVMGWAKDRKKIK
ncbi:ALG6/ALG8 family glucosyltransferase xit isoform X2 [Oratosquilla oratoria]|uniref:ALG6/ALG8 family glucosyltransferase xit isoform X2 n=1 Tax=Oratosquilla oratoria TaxID=337810 RepID=UPI003F764184